MEKLKCKVVMLPTEKAKDEWKNGNHLTLGKISGHLHFTPIPWKDNSYDFHHLYFVSNREIKEGDWYYAKDLNALIKKCNTNPIDLTNVYKIEATTDPTLGLPLIPQSFVEKYVEKQGEIKDVMIDMEASYTSSKVPSGQYYFPIIKVRKDNTVICSSIKDIWTREEIEELFLIFVKDCDSNNDLICHYNGDYKNLKKWIEDNL